MQRKLSEIAEIPKILSSTLATVSETFDKLTNVTQQQKRKFSYDEDAYDYELSDNDDNGEEFDADKAYLELKERILQQQHSRQSKDATPESDYASENGDGLTYSINDNHSSSEEEDTVQLPVDFTSYVKNEKEEIKVNSTPNDYYPRQYHDEDDSDEDDFLTTTFTWHLRNLRKSELIEKECEQRSSPTFTSTTTIDDNVDIDPNSISNYDNAFGVTSDGSKDDAQQKQHKLDKLERCWPWADRERIIYKQSTCHLVPRQPLGLIEKRIQLLAKNHLLEHLTKSPSP
uniref:Uncharacterized protein n=1 Tax=Glossina brevipalpis TaxID=37001 RepID=A0A1A9X4U2_9MUSC